MNWLGRTALHCTVPAVLLILGGVLVTTLGEPFHVRVAYVFFANLVIVLGLQIFMGNSNVANLGHVAFAGIAGYTVALLHTPVALKASLIPTAPFGISGLELAVMPAVAIALAITMLVAFISGLGLCRLTGVAATIGTLALLVIVHVVLVNWVSLTRGPRAFYGVPVALSLPWAIGTAVIAVFIAKLFRESNDGVQLRASGDNLVAAKSMGVNVERLRLKAWVLSAFVCGAGGILYTLFMGTISPNSFYFNLTFLTIAMLILGGMRSVSGAVSGSIVVAVGFEVFRGLENGPVVFGVDLPEMFGLTGFFLGTVIVLSLTFRPTGLMGNDEWEAHWGQFRAWWKGRRVGEDGAPQSEQTPGGRPG